MAHVLESKDVLSEIKAIRKDLDFIKEHIEDLFLSPEDEEALAEAEQEYLEGKSISLADFKKEMGD